MEATSLKAHLLPDWVHYPQLQMAVQLLASRQKFIRSEGIKLHHPWTLKLFRAFIVDLFGPFPQPERQSAWTLTISKGQQAKIPRLSFGDISKFRRELWLALLQIFLDMFVDPGGQGAWAMAVATGQWHIVHGHNLWRWAPGGGKLQGSCRHQQCKRHQSPHGSDGYGSPLISFLLYQLSLS